MSDYPKTGDRRKMTRNRIGILLSLGALGIAGANLQAQVREQQLEQPNATFPEAFSLIQGVRELADGRVMLADPLGQALVVADLGTGRADTLDTGSLTAYLHCRAIQRCWSIWATRG
jgi:hypothetical protein